jgi:hypothetical protein
MRFRKSIVLVAGAVLLCGCPTVHPHYSAQPEPLAVQGAYVHAASKIVMPESIGSFQRDTIIRYDADGFDVSAGYNLVSPSHAISATVYVYPAPSLVSFASPPDVVAEAKEHLTEGEFERIKQAIQRARPGGALIEQSDFRRTEGGQSYSGKLAVFEYEGAFIGSKISLRSRLYLFCYVGGKWTVEYRFTYPNVKDADKEIEEFIHQWSWFGTGV